MACNKLYTVGRAASAVSRLSHRMPSIQQQCARRFFGTEKTPNRSNTGRLLFYSVGIGALVGGGYAAYTSLNQPNKNMATRSLEAVIIDKLPSVKITRKIHNPKDKNDLDLVLFQYQTCPFCCKVILSQCSIKIFLLI